MEGDRILLNNIARQLEVWAEESRVGGWSTHQVEPMKKLSKEIYEHLGRIAPQPCVQDGRAERSDCGHVFKYPDCPNCKGVVEKPAT